MDYIEIEKLDYNNTFFHFSRIANRNSIQQNGIIAVAGGENEAGDDSKNPTTYFAYGVDGLLKAVDVWIKWEYNRLRWSKDFRISPSEQINDEIMKETYKKVYENFKDRMYYRLDLIEGENPETSDFSFDGIDKKKEHEYSKYLEKMSRYERGTIEWKPHYPNKDMEWMYGAYSDFSNGNIKQDNWNMNTHIGERVIPIDRIKIIQATNGRTDALSIALEIYDKFRKEFPNVDLSRLDDFMSYAIERHKDDKDYQEGMPDIGKREITKEEEEEYQRINKINPQKLGRETTSEMEDTVYTDETDRDMAIQEKLLQQTKDNQQIGG